MLSAILSDLGLWLTGWPHLWNGTPHGRGANKMAITYKAGWGPFKFALLYATTYLAGTLAGYGIVSLSRAWFERSHNPKYRLARFMTRLMDHGRGRHGAHTGPWLWGTASRRPMTY